MTWFDRLLDRLFPPAEYAWEAPAYESGIKYCLRPEELPRPGVTKLMAAGDGRPLSVLLHIDDYQWLLDNGILVAEDTHATSER